MLRMSRARHPNESRGQVLFGRQFPVPWTFNALKITLLAGDLRRLIDDF